MYYKSPISDFHNSLYNKTCSHKMLHRVVW